VSVLRYSFGPEDTLTWNAPVCKRELRKRLKWSNVLIRLVPGIAIEDARGGRASSAWDFFRPAAGSEAKASRGLKPALLWRSQLGINASVFATAHYAGAALYNATNFTQACSAA
jgi:hypothetical protein